MDFILFHTVQYVDETFYTFMVRGDKFFFFLILAMIMFPTNEVYGNPDVSFSPPPPGISCYSITSVHSLGHFCPIGNKCHY